MDIEKEKHIENVVVTMKLSGMNLSKEDINLLRDVEYGKVSSKEARKQIIKKYKEENTND